jgi:hypothetical protein
VLLVLLVLLVLPVLSVQLVLKDQAMDLLDHKVLLVCPLH